MSKRLEEFIKKNSAEFDDIEPTDDLWASIEKKLPGGLAELPKRETKTFSMGFVMRVAATVIVIMAIGFILYIKNEKTGTNTNAVALTPEYVKQQVHYTSLIESKRTELKTLTKNDPQLYHEFSIEIAKMDSTYKKLNSELAASPNQERVLHAMIRTLQIQTDMLNQQLQLIEQFNQMKKEQQHEIKDI